MKQPESNIEVQTAGQVIPFGGLKVAKGKKEGEGTPLGVRQHDCFLFWKVVVT